MLRHRNIYRVGDTIVFERSETSGQVGGSFEELADVAVAICASHNGVIHDPKELGGECWVCRAFVCVECAKVRCVVHRRIVCSEHARELRGQIICTRDSLFQLLKVVFRGSQTGD